MKQTELFIGLVGAAGTDLGMVADEIAVELDSYAYQSHRLRLSEYLQEMSDVADFSELPYDERVWEAMTAGDRLRVRWDRDDALALRAISDIVATRRERATEVIEDGDRVWPVNLQREAFILRSLKTQDELETLRAVYGSRFVLIAASSPDDARERHLEEEIRRSRKSADRSTWEHLPTELMDRDLKEEVAGGQDTRGTFHQADFFIRAETRETTRADVARVLSILFGHPYRTPTRDEYAQFQAAGASLRSAELGRQVGAALVDAHGSVIALGSNEVPRPGGGSPWEEDGEGNREFEQCDRDTNRVHQERIAAELRQAVVQEIERELAEAVGTEASRVVTETLGPSLDRLLLERGLNDLTEYGRAVHAELSALLDAARRGVPVADATLHTTTFPCHNCARHIVGAGVGRVVYIEPYAKSKAGPLHGDSIVVSSSGAAAEGKIAFEPFVGVAPRRYLQLFNAQARERQGHLVRKDSAGNVQCFVKREAVPVFGDVEPEGLRPVLPTYRQREVIALAHYQALSEMSRPQRRPTASG